MFTSVDRTLGAPVEEFICELKLTFPVLLDSEETTKNFFRVRGLPQTVLIDRRGRVARHVYGSLDWFGRPARRVIEQLLGLKGKKISSTGVRDGG
jgi:peroxiredoxin